MATKNVRDAQGERYVATAPLPKAAVEKIEAEARKADAKRK